MLGNQPRCGTKVPVPQAMQSVQRTAKPALKLENPVIRAWQALYAHQFLL
jgi:hypothetical protein